MKKLRNIGIISILCTLLLCIGLFVGCNTNDNNDNNEENEDNSPLTYTYNESDDCYLVKAKSKDISGDIIIPANYNGKKVNIAASAFSQCSKIESVTITNSVTSIGNEAFSYCTKLTSVTLPDSITSIGNSAFWNCTSLTGVILGTNVTAIGNSAFKTSSGSVIKVYYKGNAEDWNKISISISDTIVHYYYSATQPTGSGYYWHYDNNNNIAVW